MIVIAAVIGICNEQPEKRDATNVNIHLSRAVSFAHNAAPPEDSGVANDIECHGAEVTSAAVETDERPEPVSCSIQSESKSGDGMCADTAGELVAGNDECLPRDIRIASGGAISELHRCEIEFIQPDDLGGSGEAGKRENAENDWKTSPEFHDGAQRPQRNLHTATGSGRVSGVQGNPDKRKE